MEGDPLAGLLAAKGQARPATTRPDNDNDGRLPLDSAAIAAIGALGVGRDARLTLRLDPARHLRLRLACAIAGQSAQAVLMQALDAHLRTIGHVERLAAEALADGGTAANGWGHDR